MLLAIYSIDISNIKEVKMMTEAQKSLKADIEKINDDLTIEKK